MRNYKNTLGLIAITFALLFVFSGCRNEVFDREQYGNCSDQKQNQGEDAVDCGGPCMPCSSCEDGQKNATETGIDCGGLCQSCEPACVVPNATTEYTLFLGGGSFSVASSENIGSGYFSTSVYPEIRFDGSNRINSITLQFADKFSPFTYMQLNETMIFKTLEYSTFTITKKNTVKLYYRADDGFSSYTGPADRDQSVFLTKIADKQILVRFCNIKAGKETISLKAVSNTF